MTAALDKECRLERYVQVANGQGDEVLESAMDKLLGREGQHVEGQLARLKVQATDFEKRYGWTSEEFYPRFERGELGDDIDFMEWSATIEMISNLQSNDEIQANLRMEIPTHD